MPTETTDSSAATSPSTPSAVTVIGLGAMGKALAGAFLDAGHSVTVWNRTPGKGAGLAARGAVVADSAEAAVRTAELVVVCVLDYDASDAILEPLGPALAGKTLVNVTADVPDRARAAAAWAAEHSIDYLDGAVMVPVPVIGTPDALLFYAGPGDLFARHESVLRALGGKTVHVGEDHGRASVYDLALLDVFYGSMGALVHAFALARAEGVDAADVAPYIATITEILPRILKPGAAEVDARSYPAEDAGLGVMAASVDHIAHASRARGLDSGQIDGIKRMTDRAIALGHFGSSWMANYEALLDPRD
ncbi:NAD(P)-dependent oxidoreductase [Streptomyces qinzhouensis]|uniref:NAD(P)-dependent oxidoreductase n=1 Tax=Streptomyces qinzhouensis TaxID=2599401 RepID=A0A5B8IKQ0_9ACTN|nr:NAD(P)-binding domain-containing protein [Streptomyces qinzhouensis]QDY79092.1 NAD(P)-dependent oxidoreductase [Streptomyces qinzhouensis]